MNQHPLSKKSAFIMLSMLIAGGAATNLSTAWGDPNCKTFSSDGYTCLECAYHTYMDSKGTCQPVSDFCQDWDPKTGACTSCFPSYGQPVNGVCSNTPVGNGSSGTGTVGTGTDDHCASYGYVDSNGKWTNKITSDCKKVCQSCDAGYFLTSSYNCVALPSNCVAVDDNGNCTKCDNNYTLDKTGACCPTVVTPPPPNPPTPPCDNKSCDHKNCKNDSVSTKSKGNDCESEKVSDADSNNKIEDCDSVSQKDDESKSCEKQSDSKDPDSRSCDEDSSNSSQRDSSESSLNESDSSTSTNVQSQSCQIDEDLIKNVVQKVKKYGKKYRKGKWAKSEDSSSKSSISKGDNETESKNSWNESESKVSEKESCEQSIKSEKDSGSKCEEDSTKK